MIAYSDGKPSADLLRLQQAEMQLAKSAIEYCHALGLSPFLVAGSALGAWRDGGIIAWDDDIDIGLVRDDYEKLLAALQDRPLPGIFLQCWKTEKGYPLAYAKLRLEGTRVEEKVWSGTGYHRGIFIDVFPFDPLPRSRFLRLIQHLGLDLVNLFLMSFSREAAGVSKSPVLRLFRRLAFVFRPVLPLRALVALREWLNRFPLAGKSGELASFEMYGIRMARRTWVKREVLLPPAKCRFGDEQMPVPADCDAYLISIFGDYRNPPPVKQQQPLHITEVDFGDLA